MNGPKAPRKHTSCFVDTKSLRPPRSLSVFASLREKSYNSSICPIDNRKAQMRAIGGGKEHGSITGLGRNGQCPAASRR